VGRIDAGGDHVGTGFLIGPGIAVTNRHVLEAIAEEVRGAAATRWIFPDQNPTIDFAEAADGSRRFQIMAVLAAGLDSTNGLVNFAHLDMALLAIEPTNAAGQPLPPPLGVIGNK